MTQEQPEYAYQSNDELMLQRIGAALHVVGIIEFDSISDPEVCETAINAYYAGRGIDRPTNEEILQELTGFYL